MKYFRFVFIIFYIFILYLIFSFSLANAEKSTETSDKTTQIVIDVYDAVTPTKESVTERHSMEDIKHFIRKAIGHFLLFASLGFFDSLIAIFFFKKKLAILLFSFLPGFFVALISEFLQTIAINRGPAISDVFLDYSGYLSAVCIILLITFIIHKNKNKRRKVNDD